ncbi:MAG: Rv1355c family protein [Bacteroidia bacterium]|nr:Rv1355c family protein [Bacteroidia bacterium]
MVASQSFRPLILPCHEDGSRSELQLLRNSGKLVREFDTLQQQVREYLKCLNPHKNFVEADFQKGMLEYLDGRDWQSVGNWVFYPWNGYLVRLLPEKEFVQLRTNRNQYKITPEEQQVLSEKRVGIVGLSVGKSIALTMAMERALGEIRLADFDNLDLSNLNRLSSSVFNLGENKAVLCAREIAEIDPYIKVQVFQDGLTPENMDVFFTHNGKLDLLVEECDGLDIKVLARIKARELGVPVIMETSDRGMLDIERFDLEPERNLLHGKIPDVNPTELKNLSAEEKLSFLLPMVGVDTISTRMKVSLMEVQKTISSWPQLAGDVVKGGGIAAETARKVLLNHYQNSGRFYVDLDDILNGQDKQPSELSSFPAESTSEVEQHDWLALAEMHAQGLEPVLSLSQNEKLEIVQVASKAPSGGNSQPWKLIFKKGYLFVFLDAAESFSFLDYKHCGAHLAIGACLRNIELAAANLGYMCHAQTYPDSKGTALLARIQFERSNSVQKLFTQTEILARHTNRFPTQTKHVPVELLNQFKATLESYSGFKLHYLDNPILLEKLAPLLAEAEMLIITHPRGHADVIGKEVRWTAQEAEETGTGIDLRLLPLTGAQRTGLKVARDYKVMKMVKSLGGGGAIKAMTIDSVKQSAGLGLLSMESFDESRFLDAGRAMEEFWIQANKLGWGLHPIVQLVFLFLKLNNPAAIDSHDLKAYIKLKDQFDSLLPELKNRTPFFLFRFTDAPKPGLNSFRKPINHIYLDTEL